MHYCLCNKKIFWVKKFKFSFVHLFSVLVYILSNETVTAVIHCWLALLGGCKCQEFGTHHLKKINHAQTSNPRRFWRHLHHMGNLWRNILQGRVRLSPWIQGANSLCPHTGVALRTKWKGVHEVTLNYSLDECDGCSKSLPPD